MSETLMTLPFWLPASYAPQLAGRSTPKADTNSSALPNTLITPHASQQRILDEAERFNVLDCGRRLGKTELAKVLLAKPGLEGKRTAYLAPIYPMSHQFYREMVDGLHSVIASKEANRRIQFPSGGFIDIWSLENGADRIRGQHYDVIVIDEAAVVLGLRHIWERVLRATLTDSQGTAWLLSTPRRGSDFEGFYKRSGGGWKSWRVPTAITEDGTAFTKVIGSNNPVISVAELEETRLGMDPQTFATEILADFEASDSDLVYTLDRETTIRREPMPWAECTWHIAGIDPGGGDPTAIVPLGVYRAAPLEPPQFGSLSAASPLHVGAHQYGEFRRKGNVSVDDMAEWLSKLLPVNQWDVIAVGETGGDVITTTLRRYGFNAIKANMSRDNIDGMVRWGLDSGRLTISPECQSSIAEFDEYRWYRKRDQSGEFFATSKADWTHGDLMDARRYAWMAVVDGVPARPRVVRINQGTQRAMGVGVR